MPYGSRMSNDEMSDHQPVVCLEFHSVMAIVQSHHGFIAFKYPVAKSTVTMIYVWNFLHSGWTTSLGIQMVSKHSIQVAHSRGETHFAHDVEMWEAPEPSDRQGQGRRSLWLDWGDMWRHVATMGGTWWHVATWGDMEWHVVTWGDMEWHVVTWGDMEWHVVTWGDMEWHVVTWGDMEWHVVTWGYMEWHVVTWGDMEWHVVTWGNMEWHVVTWGDMEWHVVTLGEMGWHVVLLGWYWHIFIFYFFIHIYIYNSDLAWLAGACHNLGTGPPCGFLFLRQPPCLAYNENMSWGILTHWRHIAGTPFPWPDPVIPFVILGRC